MKKNIIFILLLSVAFLFSGCGGEEDYLKESDLGLLSQGNITVTLDGKSFDGQDINETFTVSKFSDATYQNSVTYSNTFNSYYFDIIRFESIKRDKYVSLGFWTDDLNDDFEGSLYMVYRKKIDANTYLNLEIDGFPYGTDMNITYNPVTFEMTGNMSFIESWGSQTGNMLNVQIEFDVELVNIIKRAQQ